MSDIRKLKLLESLKIDETVNSIENKTKEQANCPEIIDLQPLFAIS